ncbi:class I SAM-dependent methyltransferase [Asanoa siamensis]|uniref:Methyltransferase type 11 domain-containing protein n=1 Tax=Asanoa siamensis TaxID=926357 RepID=A0ABQ4CLF3_9ACTN|nr:methyltransferase domain-containing protein [Asanoa siamensis]GIF72110.1 hypothetical protein Asi02nite_16280 [Asanoa siamensis]
MPESPWLDAWNRGTDVYVSDRHKDRHFRAMADGMIALLPPGAKRVLDYGPGDALFAGDVAAASGEVILCEAADSIRARLHERFADHPAVSVIGPAGLTELPAGSVDLVVTHSVVQYLTPAELDAFLATAARLLSPTGRLVISDIVPSGVRLFADAWELLRFAARDRFLVSAVVAMAGVLVSPYARLRRQFGLARYDEQEMIRRAAAVGLTGARRATNLGNDQTRWAFEARHPHS